MLDIAPFNEGHLLILPKAHAVEVEELEPAVAYVIMDASRKLSATLQRVFRPDGITISGTGEYSTTSAITACSSSRGTRGTGSPGGAGHPP